MASKQDNSYLHRTLLPSLSALSRRRGATVAARDAALAQPTDRQTRQYSATASRAASVFTTIESAIVIINCAHIYVENLSAFCGAVTLRMLIKVKLLSFVN